MIGIITGSGLYELSDLKLKEERIVDTPYGKAGVSLGIICDKDVAFIARHGKNHEFLSNMINYRANIYALKELGTRAIISTSVMGVVDGSLNLAKPIVFDDIYFADNRLPDGTICTFFNEPGQPGRAHYIFSSPFSSYLKALALSAANCVKIDIVDGGTYGHVGSPRFNSKSEVRQLQLLGITAISQTCGPEAVLAGELEIPYQLIGFGIDYANGISAEPTPVEVLNENLNLASRIMPELIKGIISSLDLDKVCFEGFLYRFD